MYWNPHSSYSIESLLDKHDTNLETILSIDNILLQVKNGDKRLISLYKIEIESLLLILSFSFSLSQPDHLMKLFSFSVATNLPEDKAIK